MIFPLSLICFEIPFFLDHPNYLESSTIPEEISEVHTTQASSSTMTSVSQSSNPLTSHVLDTAIGKPAAGVPVTLSKYENGVWKPISMQLTDADGRVGYMISAEEFTPSKYKLTFETLSYYESRGEKTFYPYIDVVFEIERAEEHYHVPILLSAYGYSTYRGS